MGKKDAKKSPKPSKKAQQRSEAPSPLHAGSAAVVAIHDRDNPAMTADSDAEISDRMARRSSGASAPDHTPTTEDKAAYRHGASGQYVEGPSMPDMTHEVAALDMADPAAAQAMRRSSAPSMPNGMPAAPDVGPALRALDPDDVSRLSE